MKKIRIKYKNKAETLKNITGKLKYGTVLPMYLFTTGDWKKNQNRCINNLKKKSWFKWPVIVRSSHNNEDSQASSLAGHFESILNVHSSTEIIEAVNKVIKSYKSNNPNVLPPPVYEEWSNYIDQKINSNDKKVYEEYLENKPTKISEGIDIDAQFNVKEIKYGERGGRYTEDETKDGRPYRRYF